MLFATELTSGQPFYMDKYSVYSPVYGEGGPHIKVSDAVYASAAFPIGFPPLRVKAMDLKLSGGQYEDRPDHLVLSDGGVFNNLGTDSFTAWESLRESPFERTRTAPLPARPKQFLVVNASSPSVLKKLSRVPGWRNMVAVARIMSVLYENTLRPRVQSLVEQGRSPGGPIVVDISESPVELANRMRCDGCEERADEALASLRRDRDDGDWHEFATRASSTKTVLSKIGVVPAVRLVRLGYLSTAVACYIRFAAPGLSSVPDAEWFDQLVDV